MTDVHHTQTVCTVSVSKLSEAASIINLLLCAIYPFTTITLLAGSPLAFLAILDIIAGALSLSSGILLVRESMGLKGDIAAGLAFASSAILVREKYQSMGVFETFLFCR